ncbi:MAG TPA: SRPBCC domain-containing protein [Acidimicrobiales bacterium]
MKATFTVPVRPPSTGWWALADPAVLSQALPGCRSVSAGGDGTLAIVTDLSVASVEGLWSGTVTYVDGDTLRIAGSGAPGTLDVVVRADPTRTTLTVSGEVDGPLATVGASVLAAAARRLAETLVANLATPDRATPPARPDTSPSSRRDPGPAIRRRAPVVAAVATGAVAAAAAAAVARRRRSQ